MKAKIEFEIEDSDEPQKDKEELLKLIANTLDEWTKGKSIITIEFTNTYETDKNNPFVNWETDSTIH